MSYTLFEISRQKEARPDPQPFFRFQTKRTSVPSANVWRSIQRQKEAEHSFVSSMFWKPLFGSHNIHQVVEDFGKRRKRKNMPLVVVGFGRRRRTEHMIISCFSFGPGNFEKAVMRMREKERRKKKRGFIYARRMELSQIRFGWKASRDVGIAQRGQDC
jgi:hypothetical protein